MILKDCNTCMIYDKDDKLLLKARVMSVEDKITLHFDDDSSLGSDTEMQRVDFFDSQIGCIKTFSRLVVLKNTDPWILEPWVAECEILQVIETVQRQKDLRVRLEKNLEFSSVKHGNFTGIVHNLSVGGLMLFTEMPLEVHEVITFRYCFLKREHEITAVILREQPMQKNYHVYGCQFMNLTNSTEKDIRQFVFRQQLKKIY